MVIAAPAVAFRVIAPFDVTVVAADRFGNIATSDADSGVMLPADYAFQPSDGGTATLLVTLITPGDQALTVADVGSGIMGSVIVTVTNPAAPPGAPGGGPLT